MSYGFSAEYLIGQLHKIDTELGNWAAAKVADEGWSAEEIKNHLAGLVRDVAPLRGEAPISHHADPFWNDD